MTLWNKNSWSPNDIFLLYSSDVVFKVLQDTHWWGWAARTCSVLGIGIEVCLLILMEVHEVLWSTMARKDEPTSDSSSSLLSPSSSLLTPSFLPLTYPQSPTSALVPFLFSIWQQPVLAQVLPNNYSVTWELTLWPLLGAWGKGDGMGWRGQVTPWLRFCPKLG